MKTAKSFLSSALPAIVAMLLAGCAKNSERPSAPAATAASWGDALDVYFSWTENMASPPAGVQAVTSATYPPNDNVAGNRMGNIEAMATMLKEWYGASVHSIRMSDPYDPVYEKMHDRAIDEIRKDRTVVLSGDAGSLDGYGTVFLGVPIWGGGLPQPMVSFLKANDLSGKRIVPFAINLGSGMGRIPKQLSTLCPNSTITEGFNIAAATANAEAAEAFAKWLDEHGIQAGSRGK